MSLKQNTFTNNTTTTNLYDDNNNNDDDSNNNNLNNGKLRKKEEDFYAQVACCIALLPVLLLGIISPGWVAALHLFGLGPITAWPLLLFAWRRSLIDFLLCCIGITLGAAGAVITLYYPYINQKNNIIFTTVAANNHSSISSISSISGSSGSNFIIIDTHHHTNDNKNQNTIQPIVFCCIGCGLCIGCVQMLHIIIFTMGSKKERVMVATVVASIVASLSIASMIIIIMAVSMTTMNGENNSSHFSYHNNNNYNNDTPLQSEEFFWGNTTARRLFQSAALPFVLLFLETAASSSDNNNNNKTEKNICQHQSNFYYYYQNQCKPKISDAISTAASECSILKKIVTNFHLCVQKIDIFNYVLFDIKKEHHSKINNTNNELSSFQQRINELKNNTTKKPLLLFGSPFQLFDKQSKIDNMILSSPPSSSRLLLLRPNGPLPNFCFSKKNHLCHHDDSEKQP